MPPAAHSIESILAAAVEIGAEDQRRHYVDQACGGDAELKRRVEELVENHFRAGGFLEAPAHTLATADETAAERPGASVGPYRLLEQLGEGGFGVVFMAEQTRPVRRRVALKVLKPGMDSKQVVARFEQERQALALMDHPHIARVLDGGATASGRPYFVMELVKGAPITAFCDQNSLPVRERLGLFADVCRAVQHAHQKGVIHRDLKPSNVLVALHDGTPAVKVIDFGIAKAVGQPLTDKTLFTHFAQMLGTPLYMSPEQAGMSGLDVDTRSDVYALGVLLYELLTGTTPFDRDRLRQADFDEVRRIIREEEPPQPSTRISSLGQAATTVSGQRRSDPRRLSRLFRGELDWVVMKALEKDRNRRYESASAFAADVQRYLADEPVLACPPSAWYRFRKFARRNRMGLALAGLALFVLLALGGGVGWAVRDRAARGAKATNALEKVDLFRREGKRAEALAAFDQAEQLAREAPADPARDARLAALKEQLDAEARDQALIARFEDVWLRVESRVDLGESRFNRRAAFPEIRAALGDYGLEIGTLPPEEAGARVQARPEPARRQIIAVLDDCLQRAPNDDLPARRWLLATLNAADDDPWRVRVRKVGEDWKALERLARAADVREQPPGFLIVVANSLPEPAKSTRLELLRRIQRAWPADLWANHKLAEEVTADGRAAEAVRYYTAALALRPDNPGIYLNRGNALEKAGEGDAAIADYRQSIGLAPGYPAAHLNLGHALQGKRLLDEAVAEYREAIRLKPDFAIAHLNLGTALSEQGRLDEAIAELREAVRLRNDYAGHYNLGGALKDKGLLDEAIAEYREAIRLRPNFAASHAGLGNVLRDKGRLDEAVAAYREAVRIDKDLALAHCNLGSALSLKGRPDEAIAAYREAIRVKPDFADAHNNLGMTLFDKGRLDDAIAAYQAAIRSNPRFAWAHNNLGNALRLKGRVDEAITEYREAVRIDKDFALGHYHLGTALGLSGRLDEAIVAFREAIRSKKDYADAHHNLGAVLGLKGRHDEAVAEMREEVRIVKDDPKALARARANLQRAERLARLNARLPAVLRGKDRARDVGECLDFALLCRQPYREQYAGAARFFGEAFAARPRLAEDLQAAHRYNAACAAALAGCGRGREAAGLGAAERARLRRQALGWLRADLEAWGRLLGLGPGNAPPAAKTMQHWLADPDFAGLRGPEALAKLPEAERRPWQQLWDDAADTLARARGKTAPERK